MLRTKEESQNACAENIRGRFKEKGPDLPRINLRIFVLAALGLIFGISLYFRCRFGGARGTDFVFFALFLAFSFRPFSLKRIGTVFLCFCLFAGAGAGLMHLRCNRFLSGMDAGEYEVRGTVVSLSADGEGSDLVLSSLTLNGISADGKMRVSLPYEGVRTGDKLSFKASVARTELKEGGSYGEYLFVKDVRYLASVGEEGVSVTGKGNAFLRLNALAYDALHSNLPATQASVAYALLTGSAGSLDEGFATAVRQGGVAHIFAVSGLHIGILYSAVSFAFRKLKRFRVLPAIAVAVLYAAFCGFSVSSVRALLMCAVLGVYGAIGRKYDFLSAIAFAATAILFVSPAEWLSAGFRLSFGACVGLALFSRPLKRSFRKLPSALSGYLAANLSVQLFTFPVLMESFGYVSVWGTLLNLFLIPVLPVLFLGLLLSVLFALIIPPAASLFLSVPNGAFSLLNWLFSFDFSLVLSGFSLGAGGALWLIGAVFLSERVRFKEKTRLFLSCALTSLFMVTLVLENAVFAGCKLIADGKIVLVETPRERVLVIDGSLSADSYRDFLSRRYGGTLDAVVVLGDDAGKGLSAALALPASELRAFEERATGFYEREVLYGAEFGYGNLSFRFEGAEKLTLTVEGGTVEIDFSGTEGLRADLFLSGKGEGTYYLFRGAVYSSA